MGGGLSSQPRKAGERWGGGGGGDVVVGSKVLIDQTGCMFTGGCVWERRTSVADGSIHLQVHTSSLPMTAAAVHFAYITTSGRVEYFTKLYGLVLLLVLAVPGLCCVPCVTHLKFEKGNIQAHNFLTSFLTCFNSIMMTATPNRDLPPQS